MAYDEAHDETHDEAQQHLPEKRSAAGWEAGGGCAALRLSDQVRAALLMMDATTSGFDT